jgi:multisubunit Na+/H+ antiporter MnhB subunit
MLLLSIYLLFKGHASPGGGFIAGLVASICIALQSLTFGLRRIGEHFPFDHHKVLTLGLFTAAGTGFVAMLFGYPFLTSAHGFIYFPLLGELEILTSFFFDLGIFLVVIGVTLRVITTIARN